MKISKKTLFTLLFLYSIWSGWAQDSVSCDYIKVQFQNFENKLDKINTKDPNLIPLHYFLIQDIQSEMTDFFKSVNPNYPGCSDVTYTDFISLYDDLSFRARNLKDTLFIQKQKVDTLFYELALLEILKENKDEALYYTERALQYNRINPDALILKLQLLFEEEQFESCVSLLHTLYNEVPLTRMHEMTLSDFTLQFYDTLFNKGDELLKDQREAEALNIFKILENFCKNMPSNYCNDDYYKGIIRSKTGVFQSYIKISRVALTRGYPDIAENFYEYARDYEQSNHEEIQDTADLNKLAHEIERYKQKFTPKSFVDKNEFIQPETDVQENIENEDILDTQISLSCEELFKKGFQLSINGDYQQAIDIFQQIKSMNCPCTYWEEIIELLKAREELLKE